MDANDMLKKVIEDMQLGLGKRYDFELLTNTPVDPHTHKLAHTDYLMMEGLMEVAVGKCECGQKMEVRRRGY